jgi:hypothetical protein
MRAQGAGRVARPGPAEAQGEFARAGDAVKLTRVQLACNGGWRWS